LYQSTPVRSRQSFRHEAFLYRSATDFNRTMVPFVDEGLDAGEPVMVALVEGHAQWLRAGLGARAAEVSFVDMHELGRNPGRIIAAWQQFVAAHVLEGRPTRGIGEPIWASRREEEIAECQLHEALLNVALDPETPFWLICPYDAEALPESVIADVGRSHHALLDDASYRGSTSYGGRAYIDSLFGAELPQVSGQPSSHPFCRSTVSQVFAHVLAEAYTADLWSDKALAVALAARQVATDSLQRGAEHGILHTWQQPGALVCELRDPTVITDVLAGRRIFPQQHDSGLWSANQNCDLVQLRSSAAGTTVRLHAWK
jgi:hypothetical protein